MSAEFEIKDKYTIDDLVSIVKVLRAPGGCPWDRAQTHDSIKKNFIEETYEVVEAINKQDTGGLKEDVDSALNSWDSAKQVEKSIKSQTDSMLRVPRELPALMRAQKVQHKAAKVGFDWDDVSGAVDKLYEEINELKTAVSDNVKSEIEDEFGDVLFSCVNIARFLDVDSEDALTGATDKFVSRFSTVEQLARERGIDMNSAGIDELDKLWDEAKKIKKAE